VTQMCLPKRGKSKQCYDSKNARSTHRLTSGDEPALFILRITI
jgi:hypothetical protein